MNKYTKIVDKRMEVVSILLEPSTPETEDFISIWVDDEDLNINSPFRNIKDAEVFADIIIKLLQSAERCIDA